FNDVTTPGACAGSYSVTRTWTAVDACGNSSTASQTINVQDVTAPVIAALPSTSTINCPATPSFATATATDSCGSGATLTFNDVTTPGACAGNYSVTRTWTAVDACGNSSSASQTINVQDVTAPVIAALPAPSTISCPATPSFATATATDGCGSGATLTFADTTNNGNCAGNYSVTRTWTAVDACGNTSTASQTINVQDTTAPTFTVPADVTINTGENCSTNLDPTAIGTVTNISDACDASPEVTYTDSDCFGNDNEANINSGNGNYFYFDVTGYANLTAKDIEKLALSFETNQGKGRAEFTLVAPSGQAVVLVGPYCTGGACEDANSNDQELYLPVFYPNSSGYAQWNNNNVIAQDIPQNFTPNGALSSPNTITGVTSYVSSFENLTGPMNGTWFVFSRKQANVNGSVNFNSVCLTPASACASNNIIVRTWTVTDECGNAASATQTITIQDITAPVIATLPGTSTINCPAAPEFAQATVTDNCDANPSLTFADVTTNGACAGSYSVTRTWTATDACGNTATASQTINVQDISAPVIATLPATSTINCPATPSFATATATDECGSSFELTFADVTTNGACAGSYSVTRTWTAVDACGNTSTASQTINVQDVTAPVIAELPATSTINCPAAPEFAQATATDECGSAFELTFADVTTNGACAGSYSVTRTWTATDACGNTATASQTINVQDVTAPVIAELPATSTIDCPASPEFTQATATDECGSAFELTFEDVTTNGACAGSYSVTRTWTAVDACGNTATASQTINVQDITAPVIAELPATSTINCPASPEFAQATATDECGSAFELTFEDVTTNGACAGSYSVTRTWTAVDACGNTATASQTINVQDINAPVIAELPAASTINCPAVPEFAQATATDECGSAFELTFEDVTTNTNCAGNYSVTRTWTAVDACGNTATASQTINVQDETAPVITGQASNIIVECDGNGNELALFTWLTTNGGATATDECSAVTWSNDFSEIANDCSAAVTVVFTATDECGNASSTSATFTINDTQDPVAPEAPASVTVACAADVPAMISLTATDNCSAPITVEGVDATTPGQCSGTFTVTRTWTFIDACGNSSSVSQTINVVDDVAPTAPEAPASVTVACAADVPAMISLTATDNCGASITVEGVDATTQGNCPGTFSITRTWTFTDACNNSSSVSQTINVVDDVAPTAPQAPASVTVACVADVPAMISLTATDNCGAAITVEGVDATTQGNCPGTFSITRTWTFVDACNNSSSVSQIINVVDDVAPTAPEAPASVTVACAADVPAMISLTATDNCGASITVEGVDATTQGECSGTFSVTRTWTFTDACNNTSSVSQIINVVDDVAPTAPEAPASVTVACAGDVPAMISLTATDNCGTSITVEGVDATTQGACPNSFTVTRTWTFADACGNSSSVSQIINVVDDVAPTAPEAPANITVACAADVPAMISLTATDNCGASITVEGVDATTPGECSGTFTVTRTWTFTDACDNSSSVSQTINVVDDVAPTAPQAPADVTVTCDGDVPAMVSLTATDNCGDFITVEGVDAVTQQGGCVGSYTITRTWTFADVCGNTSSVEQIINVNDNVAPTIPTEPFDVTVACSGDVPAMISLTATDNCGGAITVEGVDVVTAGTCANMFTVTRTWTFADACGNTSSVEQIITVNDNIAPAFVEVAPANTTASCDNIPTAAVLTATDNCGTASVTMSETIIQGNCPSNYQIVRTWTATDACNNTSSQTQTITVSDTTGPVLVTELDPKVDATCDQIPPVPVLVFTDNCSGTVTTPEPTITVSSVVNGSYTITRTWVATDACGNLSQTYTQFVFVDEITDVITLDPLQLSTGDDIVVSLDGLLPAGVTGGTWTNVNNVTPGFDPVNNTFNPFGVTPGEYLFSYIISDGLCPISYNVLIIIGAVEACDTVVIHNAFTPNGDGLNEYFSIENIEDFDCYPTNNVQIYNRWGVLVYETKDYDNNTRRFEGISEGRVTVSKSEELPAGTYFYIIEWTIALDGTKVTKDGYLYLTR
ncbi:HYR-like domain-containing protein, partial [Flavobacterium terrisoli]|uniref:HYR-like domain-containing protein n=1 Tax=Flavobacterium terrisoli TaxID=3242195 RepID=UPI0025429CCF